MTKQHIEVPDQVLMSKIYIVRGKKVMLDRDLAELYDVETRRLKEQVRRNRDRFPSDFMFEMTKEELNDWMSQFATSNSDVMGMRILPFVFTEHGVLMLSSVLNSKRAIAMNIQIMRIFTKMNEVLLTNKDLLLKINQIENSVASHDEQIRALFNYLKKLVEGKKKGRTRIGYNRK